MNDKTGTESATPPAEAEEPGRNSARHATRLLVGAALLSTTALLPAFEAKVPPYQGD